MIVAFDRVEPELKELVEVPATPDERARNLKEIEEFSRNVAWFNEHGRDIYAKHAGKYMVVLGQELFVGDDSKEVRARARAAHPECTGGSLARSLPRPSGQVNNADQR